MIQNQQHRRESTEKKILIPLNEESSEEEEEDDISLSSNDLIETRKDQPLQDPKFIVTLDGINSSYFKSKDNFGSANINAEQAMDLTAKNNINVTIPVHDTSPKTVSLVKQTSLKTADVARSQKPAIMINKPTASIAPMPEESTRLSLPKAASKPPPKQQNE